MFDRLSKSASSFRRIHSTPSKPKMDGWCREKIRAGSICMLKALTANVAPDVLGNGPEDKPWGMYEFSWGHRSGLDRAINGNFIKLRWSRLGDLRTPGYQ
jgi:hypothetical protein